MSTPNPIPCVVLAVASGDSLVGGHCIGFVVAAEAGGEIGRVFGIRRNRGMAYEFAATVTEATPAIADPIAELFAVFAASRVAG